MLALLTLPVQKEPDLGPCAQRILALWPDLSIGLLGLGIAKVAAGARSDPPPVNVYLLLCSRNNCRPRRPCSYSCHCIATPSHYEFKSLRESLQPQGLLLMGLAEMIPKLTHRLLVLMGFVLLFMQVAIYLSLMLRIICFSSCLHVAWDSAWA
jgi:hypothetical protein